MIPFIKLPVEACKRMWARTYINTFRVSFLNRRYQQLQNGFYSGRIAYKILGKKMNTIEGLTE